MIPTKLYIPTSTLNFNNIMSSESVSPASFYARRGFGHKRFTKVEANNLDNRIILYEKYPIFEIHDQELENYPLVIEIDTKSLNEDIVQEQNGFFFADETIYLNPFTTKIYFCNEQEKVCTLSKAESSIETKMVVLYSNRFTVKPKNIESFEWKQNEIEDSTNDNYKFILKDRKINKLKGLLYAYLLAANKLVSPDVVSLKKYARSLQNTLSAIITSPDGRANSQQETQLKSLYKEINGKIQSIILKEKAESYKCDFAEILKKENLFEYWLRQNNYSKYQITEFNAPKEDKDKAFDKYIQDIDKQIANLENNQRKSKIEITQLPTIQNDKVFQIFEQKEFLTKLFNEYLKEVYNSEDFVQSRYKFAMSGGTVFKEELLGKWDGSESRQYVNALLTNLNEYSAFDINSTSNLTLESFAAFCQKGDSDIDKLEDYLISNEIGDFRIAFSLWGIVFGFANMPKTLTNDLFLSDDLEYVSEVYKYIFKQIHNIDLVGSFERKQEFISISSKTNEQPRTEEKTGTTIKQEVPEEKQYREKLRQAKIKDKQIDFVIEALKENQFLINEKLFLTISKNKGFGKTSNVFKEIKECLQPNQSKNIFSQNSTLDGFNLQPEKDFYKDFNAGGLIENLLPDDKKIRKQFKYDFDWFQEEYKKGNSSKYYDKANRENSAVIDSFKRYIEKKKYANQLNIESIISKLKELYP